MTRDRGSATVWVLAAIGVLALMTAVAALRAEAVFARHRAETAADFAALAAAAQLEGGGRAGEDGGGPCASAAVIAAANGAALVSCEPQGDSVRIVISRSLVFPVIGERTVNARARAAVLPAS